MFILDNKLNTSCAACSGATTVCPAHCKLVVTWTVTQSFQLGGHHACQWCGSSYFILYHVWSS